jgi:ribokinase
VTIVVFGSINMDLVVRSPRLPAPGETISGTRFNTFPGGKGANQAVACARLGIPAIMVGRIGDDSFGSALIEGLRASGVDVSYVETDTSTSSGVALIQVDDAGENTIVIVPGANGRIDQSDLTRLEKALDCASALLLQLEIPLDIVLAAAHLAREKGVRVILDPAPAQQLSDDLLSLVDIVTPNETEAGILTGITVQDRHSAMEAGRKLLARGVKHVVVKMGSQGAIMLSEEGESFYEAINVEVVDTVAAGDAFNGGLAAALSEGLLIHEAMSWAIATGALSVTKEGAQPAMPTREALQMLLD